MSGLVRKSAIMFGVDVLDANVAGGDSVFNKKMSDVYMARLVGAAYSIVAELDGCFIVLVNSCWRHVVA